MRRQQRTCFLHHETGNNAVWADTDTRHGGNTEGVSGEWLEVVQEEAIGC
jgi:hypothetical protein